MPSRIIKESTRTSDTLAQISAEAERLFWRLVVSADDYGRFDARPHIVLGHCLAPFLARGSVTVHDVSRWLGELKKAGLIILYIVDGKPYLQLTTWDKHQRAPRAKESKYPAPPADADTCGHLLSDDSALLSDDSNCAQVSSDASESKESRIDKEQQHKLLHASRQDGAQRPADDGDGEKITNRDLIAELGNAYRSIPGIPHAKGDYAFIGRLYNEFGYDRVLEAIQALAYRVEAGEVPKQPLLYLRGIITNPPRAAPQGKTSFERTRELFQPGTRDEDFDDWRAVKKRRNAS